MSTRSDWMASRRPAPPPDFAAALDFGAAAGALEDQLAEEARRRLAQARAKLGRVRESAFRLLEADALLTYACEAALEREEPRAALQRILDATVA
jgi:sRNA-binding protein